MTELAKKINLSIVVPVFNTLDYLPQCMESLLQQTLDHIELILVDNGSTDGSYEYLQDLQNLHKGRLIRVFRIKGGRQGRCRNFGITQAQGEYIGFADSDDWCAPDMFKYLLETAKHYDADICFGRVLRADPDKGSEDDHYESKYFKEGLYNEFELPYLTRMSVCYNKVYRAELLKQNDIVFLEGVIHEDVTFNFKALYLANNVCSSFDAKYFWRQHALSSTKLVRKDSCNAKVDLFAMIEAIRTLEQECGFTPAWRQAVNRTVESHVLLIFKQFDDEELGLSFLREVLCVSGYLPERLEISAISQIEHIKQPELVQYLKAQKRFKVLKLRKLEKYKKYVKYLLALACALLISNLLLLNSL